MGLKKFWLIVTLAAFSTFAVFALNGGSKKMAKTLRVAFPYGEAARFYEPTRIHLAPEYIFLENTFSPLVELSPQDGTIQKGIAEKWEWHGNELRFTIRSGLKTIDGVEITAKDAEFSLKRLLVRTGNTHGNFKDLVCGAAEIKSIENRCDGIRVEGNQLILKISGRSAFVLPMLSGIDFAIIPKSSVDARTLDIIDYRNTSGPYYVSQDSEVGEIELALNHNHYHASQNIPQLIKLVPTKPTDKTASLELFKDDRVDLITTIDAARPEQVFRLSQELGGTTLHTTANIRTFGLFFTDRGMKEFTLEQRLALGRKVKESLAPHFLNLPGYENADQFFPIHGDGAIETEEAKKLGERKPTIDTSLPKEFLISIVRSGDVSTYQALIKGTLPFAQVVEGKTAPVFEKYQRPVDEPHAYIAGPDTGFNEDISLISYSLTVGFFGLAADQRQKWLADYMSMPEKSDRLQMLRSLHKSALTDVLFVPLFSSPYTALARSSWKINLSKILANNQLWLINAN